MSNIIFAKNMPIQMIAMREVLQRTIKDVLTKIHETDTGITWIIYDEDNCDKEKNLINGIGSFISMRTISLVKQYKYGFCNINQKKIWISTQAILAAPILSQIKIPVVRGLFSRNPKNLLVDVILDEIAHIKAGADHGKKKYDNTLCEYRKKYYTDIF